MVYEFAVIYFLLAVQVATQLDNKLDLTFS